MLVTAQYTDKPVMIGPYWKIEGKIKNYQSLKNQKKFQECRTKVENTESAFCCLLPMLLGINQPLFTESTRLHADIISKDILMQNPDNDELILVKEGYVGSYFSIIPFPDGFIKTTWGGINIIIVPKLINYCTESEKKIK